MTGYSSSMMLQKDLNCRRRVMVPGISSYTYTWAVGVPGSLPAKPLSAVALIDKAFELGLNLVQIADNLPLETWDTEKLSALLNYADSRNVSIEMGSRGLQPEHTVQCLKTASFLRSPILRMVIDNQGFEPGLRDIIAIIRELIPEFRSAGIKLALENHDRLKAREFEQIIEKTGSDMVGICLDSVNSMGAGEGFEEVAKILIPHTINFHVKDFSIRRVSHKMGIIIEGTPAGRGRLNISEVVNRLNETGRCSSAILELWTPPEDDIEETIRKEEKWANESIEYLKKIII